MSKRKTDRPKRDYPSADSLTWVYLIGQAATKRHGETLKIGITGVPKKRMQQHRSFGAVLLWQHFCTSGPRVLALEIERAACRAFARIGRQCAAPAGEEFEGIDRKQAEQIVRDVSLRVRENFAGFAESKVRYQAETQAWRAFRARLTEAA